MSTNFKQTAEYDCFLACIATHVGIPPRKLFPEEFFDQVEDKQGTHGNDVRSAFSHAGLRHNVDYRSIYIGAYTPDILELVWGRRAMIQVPSLNTEAAMHIIYWDGKTIFDPSTKQTYRWLNQLKPVYVWIFNEREVQRAV